MKETIIQRILEISKKYNINFELTDNKELNDLENETLLLIFETVLCQKVIIDLHELKNREIDPNTEVKVHINGNNVSFSMEKAK